MVLARLAVAAVDSSLAEESDELVELVDVEVRLAASAFLYSRSRSALLRAEYVLVAWISAASRSLSTISSSPRAMLTVIGSRLLLGEGQGVMEVLGMTGQGCIDARLPVDC